MQSKTSVSVLLCFLLAVLASHLVQRNPLLKLNFLIVMSQDDCDKTSNYTIITLSRNDMNTFTKYFAS